ncbi:hypothetical protein AURDEDRAFT_127143 [Auricularia subglabra TFB-10046 SS5]|uniref:Uncharacterized protein n=1 Tax=Auricularia subglabra (strain TFB-10046 / SS5) TaxID=717982 RepID=J0DDF8_AURST|nr:hypothetical protein AURDEDRAFT_127143 [Auricularia subglabra TFB-10046 SS5]
MQYEQHPASPAKVSLMLRPVEWAAPTQTLAGRLAGAPSTSDDDGSEVDATTDVMSSSQEDAITPDSTLGSHSAGSPAPATAKTETKPIAAALADANDASSVASNEYPATPWAWEGSLEQGAYYLQDQLPWLCPETFAPAYEGSAEPNAEYDASPAADSIGSHSYSNGRHASECLVTFAIVGHVCPALLTVLNGPDTPEREALLAVLDHDGYRA